MARFSNLMLRDAHVWRESGILPKSYPCFVMARQKNAKIIEFDPILARFVQQHLDKYALTWYIYIGSRCIRMSRIDTKGARMEKANTSQRTQVSFWLPTKMVNRLRCAGAACGVSRWEICCAGLGRILGELEKKHNGGKPFPSVERVNSTKVLGN